MRSIYVLISACALLCASSASAGSGGSGASMTGGVILPGPTVPPSLGYTSPYAGLLQPATNYAGLPHKVRALLELRRTGLKMRADDGGTLTPEHRAYLQAQLDAIQAGQQ